MSRGVICGALVAIASVVAGPARAGDVASLASACAWLEAAVVTDPGRDDAFGMFMRAMRPKCQGALEGLARRDGSVSDATVSGLVTEIGELREALGEVAPAAPDVAVPAPTPAVAEPADASPAPNETDTVVRPSPDTRPAGPRGAVSGTWFQAPRVVLDRHVKRTLDLYQREEGQVEGELYEEVWHDAPASWVDTSCGGNATFRMVTTARIAGEARGDRVDLRRDVPRVLACTCPSRCRVEQRRRGLSLALSPSGMQLSDETGVFVREGAPPAPAAGVDGGGAGFGGEWETGAFERRGERVVLHLALSEDGGAVSGTLTVRSDQELPLKSWSDRFCDGADRFLHVDAFDVSGERRGRELALAVKGGRVVACTCPSKCLTPRRRRLTLTLTPDARSLTSDEATFERR